MRFVLRSRVAALGVAALLTACSDATTGPSSDAASFSAIPVSQASAELAASNVKVEVQVKAGSSPLVATKLGLDHPNMAGEPEQVQANIKTFAVTGTDGVITTDLGVVVTFDAKTVFAQDEGSAVLTLDQFAGAINSALTAGRHPHVRAARPAPATPQAPTDTSFLAAGIKLGGTSTVLEIDLNAGPTNLTVVAAPPPDAILKLLGLTIEIRISEGITKVGDQRDPAGQAVDFEGPVKSVDTAKNLFVLVSGTTVNLTTQTTIRTEGDLRTLAQVAAAVAAGVAVKAEGHASVVTTDPRVLSATTVAFETHRDITDFHEIVKAVDPTATPKTITLSNGITLCFDDHSTVNQEGTLKTLADVAAALTAGKIVGVSGTVAPPPAGSTCRATVIKVRFDVLVPAATEFHEPLKSVDTTAKTLTLGSGLILCLNAQTVIDNEGDLHSLADVAAALKAGKLVGAGGSAGPTTDAGSVCKGIVSKVRFSLAPPPTTTFREGLKAVDTAGKTITLTNGVVLCVDDHTVIDQGGAFKTLADAAAALTARTIVASGTATTAPEGASCRGLLVTLKFSI